MKKVIFLCLLSISMCISKPADTPAAGAVAQPVTSHADETKLQQATETIAATPTETKPQTTAENKVPEPVKSEEKTPEAIGNPVANATALGKEDKVAANDTKQADTNATNTTTTPAVQTKDNQTQDIKTSDNKTPGNKITSTVDPKSIIAKPTEKPVNNGTKPNEKNETTTVKPAVTTKPTEASKTDDKQDTAKVETRKFDGPSFIGGMILTLGLLAIGFMGFKYYKTQTERNYHTL